MNIPAEDIKAAFKKAGFNVLDSDMEPIYDFAVVGEKGAVQFYFDDNGLQMEVVEGQRFRT